MEDYFLAWGLVICIFALIALMPPFDGKWGGDGE